MICTSAKVSILNNQGEGMPFNTVIRTKPRFERSKDQHEEWGNSLDWQKPFTENIIAVLGK